MNNADFTRASATEKSSSTITATKRRAEGVKTKAPQTPISFLTFTDPSEFLSKRTRLAVRSHVTTRQHREARSRGAKLKQFVAQTPDPAASRSRAVQHATNVETVPSGQHARLAAIGDARNHSVLSLQEGYVSEHRPPADGLSQSSHRSSAILPPLRSGPSYSSTSSHDSTCTGLSSSSASTTATSIAPSGVNASEFETMLKSVEEYLQVVFGPLWWSAIGAPEQYRMEWEDCMDSYAAQDPALYYARLLFTSGHLLETGVVRAALCDMLKRKTTAAVHESLTSNRRTSNGLILAIGCLAFYDSMYGGDPHIAHRLHRPAQARIIQARGGLDCVDVPEIVKAVMLWEDAVMTLRMGGEPFLASRDDLCGWNDDQALHALRLWIPEQYAALLLRRGDSAGSPSA